VRVLEKHGASVASFSQTLPVGKKSKFDAVHFFLQTRDFTLERLARKSFYLNKLAELRAT